MKKDRKQIRLERNNKSNQTLVSLNPIMPRKYNYMERKRLREFEKELLKERKLDLEEEKIYKLERKN